jgi:hypothetical protein
VSPGNVTPSQLARFSVLIANLCLVSRSRQTTILNSLQPKFPREGDCSP